MIIKETKSCHILIDKENNRVTKVINQYWMKKCPWLIINEVRALKKLKGKHFPELISSDDNSIVMEYAGESIKQPGGDGRILVDAPQDLKKQIGEIIDELDKANLRHSDINPQNLLVKDGIVKLIDFEFCLEKDEIEPKNYLNTMGIESKVRNFGEKIDDKVMAERTLNYLNGGTQKILDALGKLPRRMQYHELPFQIQQKAHRKYLKQRIEILESVYDFKGKKGIDLGCNIGGLTFSLALKGSKMVGVEIQKAFVDIANTCEDYYSLGTKFYTSEISGFVKDMDFLDHYDFCLFLATWHWVVKQKGIDTGIKVLKKVSEICDKMFFEIPLGKEQGIEGAEETMIELGLTTDEKVINFIKSNTSYTKVRMIGKCIGWGNRPCYICEK